MRPSVEFWENASGPYVIPLRAHRGGAAEKRTGEPSRPALLGAGNSSSSLKAGAGGQNREKRCEDLSASGFLAASHGQVSWTSQVLDWPYRTTWASSFHRWRNRHEHDLGLVRNVQCRPWTPGSWVLGCGLRARRELWLKAVPEREDGQMGDTGH